MSKHTDEQLLAVSSSCAAYLGEKFVYERGLFQGIPPTQMMIRSLANRMVQGSMGTLREESDPHIVVGVMLYALKSLRFCLFHEADTLLQGIEITEDYHGVKRSIGHMLVQLSQNRLHALALVLELVSKIFTINSGRRKSKSKI